MKEKIDNKFGLREPFAETVRCRVVNAAAPHTLAGEEGFCGLRLSGGTTKQRLRTMVDIQMPTAR